MSDIPCPVCGEQVGRVYMEAIDGYETGQYMALHYDPYLYDQLRDLRRADPFGEAQHELATKLSNMADCPLTTVEAVRVAHLLNTPNVLDDLEWASGDVR